MHWRILLFTFLSTTPTHGLNAQANENKDEGSFYSPLVAELDTFAIERAAFDPTAQHNLNWTRSGHPGSPTRTLPRSLLEARQASPQCTPSNYVLSCPITEASPCCPPGFPVCCHNGICCPENFFCTGLQTCCLNGAVGCGDGCCSSPLVCGTVAGTQTCVDPGSSNVAAPTTASASTTIGASGGGAQTTTGGAGAGSSSSSVTFANPSYTPADGGQSTTNVAVIGGAVGGGVGALLLIALLAWYLLRQKKVKAVAEPGGPETIATPYTNGRPAMVTAFSHDTSPAYPEGHVPPTMNKGNHPWSTNSSGGMSGFPYGGSGALGTSYGHSTSSPPPPGSVFGGIATVSDTGSSGVVGPGGYVPPPPEDIPTTTSPGPGGGSHYSGGPTGYGGGAAMPPSSAYSPPRHESMSAAGAMYNSNVNPPWVEGVGSASEQHQPQQRYSQHQHAWSGSGISGPTHDPSSTPWTSGVPSSQPPQPLLPQQQLQMHQPPPPRPWLDSREGPSPGPMTPPPPPFSPGPFGPPPQEGASSGGGRVVPMTAPADHKAKPTKTLSGTGT